MELMLNAAIARRLPVRDRQSGRAVLVDYVLRTRGEGENQVFDLTRRSCGHHPVEAEHLGTFAYVASAMRSADADYGARIPGSRWIELVDAA